MTARLPLAAVPVTVRDAASGDRARVATMLAAMDRDGLYRRHFATGDAPNQALLARLVQPVDARRVLAALAIAADGQVVGHAEHVADGDGVDFAIMVLPGWRRRGIARALLTHLTWRARAAGHRRLHGHVQSTNGAMLAMMRDAGFRMQGTGDATVVMVERHFAGPPGALDAGIALAWSDHADIRCPDHPRALHHLPVGD